jgi:thiol-disulfide isomerase/thioredoxin
MIQHRHLALALALLLAAGAAGVGVYEWLAPAAPPAAQVQAQVAPAMAPGEALGTSMDDVDGTGSRKLADWRGKALLVNFWATWCGPCREEIPLLVKLQAKYAAQGLQVIGIATDETDRKRVQEFLRRMVVNYPMLMGDENVASLVAGFGGNLVGLPYTVVLDRNGRPLKVHAGELNPDEAEKLVQMALLQPAVPSPVTPTPATSTATAKTAAN